MGAEGRPILLQLALIQSSGLLHVGEVLVRNLEQLGEVDFGGVFAEELAIEDQFGGVAFFLDIGFES